MSTDAIELAELETQLEHLRVSGIEAAETQLELAKQVLESAGQAIEEAKNRHARELSELDARKTVAQRAVWQADKALENAKKPPKRTPRRVYG